MSKSSDGPEPRIVNLPAPEILWSMAIKARDDDHCIVCEATDELTAKLIEGRSIADEEGRLNLDSGLTLCARCNILYDNDQTFREKAPSYLKPRKTTRLNVEVDKDLYSKFMAVCRYRGTSISRAVREHIMQQISEVEDGSVN